MDRRLYAGQIIGVFVTLCLFCNSSEALEVLEPGFSVELYSSYRYPVPTASQGTPRGMRFDSYGNLYISQWQHYPDVGQIYKVTPDGTATRWVEGLGTPRRMVWAEGTEYGDFLYVVDATPRDILRFNADGTYTTFAHVSAGPHCLVLDRTGNYGGYMYTATRAVDHTYRIDTDGTVTQFSHFPGSGPGGPLDLEIDPGANYGGLMYMALHVEGDPRRSGVFTIYTDGSAERFAPAIVTASEVEIDPVGLFGGYFFIGGKYDLAQELSSISRAEADGSVSEFIVGTTGTPAPITFGPDGAMYVAEYSFDEQLQRIYRIVPYAPVEVAVEIKPGGCPNPLNAASRGLLPVAVLGSDELDVTTIDVASVRLEDVAPIRSSYEDAAAAVAEANACDCNATLGPDGYLDLTLKFRTQDVAEQIVNAIGAIAKGDELQPRLTGSLSDGTAIVGDDCVRVVGKVPATVVAKKSDITN